MNDYSALIPIILAVLGGGIGLFFKNKADKLAAKDIMSDTKIKDAPLEAKQIENESKIKEVDKGIQDMLNERRKLRDKYLTDQEKADSWNKKD